MRLAFAIDTLIAGLMNLCLALLPFASAEIAITFSDAGVYRYDPTPEARRATRAEIEHLAERLIPANADRRRAWEELIARELREGDPHAARGFALAAPRLLGPIDRIRLAQHINAKSSDAEITAAAAALLSNETRESFSLAAAYMAGNDAAAARNPAAFLVEGRASDFAAQARAWLSGRDRDHLSLVLTGIGAALDGQIGANIALGASALKDARRAGRLRPAFAARLEDLAEAAFPSEQLRAGLSPSLSDPATLANESRAAARAFSDAMVRARFSDFANALFEIGEMAAATSSRGAGRLLAQADALSDLPRLRLAAQAGGDRAVAVAKRLPEGAPLAQTAHGTLYWSQSLALKFAALIALMLGMIAATLISLAQAFRSTET
ncbi:MAG: hypothetical protein AB7O04_02040, partial [Hyphomonadaceae bacterium]